MLFCLFRFLADSNNLKTSSEPNWDWGIVGLLDTTLASGASSYTTRISGESEQTVTVSVPSAGNHYIDIGYKKDGSISGGSDCAWYSVLSGDSGSSGDWWMSAATVSFQNGQWLAGAWSIPVKVTGEDGSPGADGKFWDYRYQVAATAPGTPSGLNPSGWSDTLPAVTAAGYLWMSYCEKDAGQTSILWGWSAPVRISGEKGQDGVDGKDGDEYEYIYARTMFPTDVGGAPPSSNVDDYVPSGWTDDPQGVNRPLRKIILNQDSGYK